MRKLIIILIFIITLTACSSSVQPVSQAVVEAQTITSTVTPEPTITPVPSNTPVPTSTPTPKPTDTPIPEPTQSSVDFQNVDPLFDDVYAWYADDQFMLEYNAALNHLNTLAYRFESTEPSNHDLGELKVYSNMSDDNVYMQFFSFSDGSPSIIGKDLLSIIAYYQSSTEKEVSTANTSTDRSIKKSKFFAHIVGGDITKVLSIQDQKAYLFSVMSQTSKPTPAPMPKTTIGQDNALSAAKTYLAMMAFSYKGLIKQLEYEQYSHEDAVYGADNCGADWNEQAAKAAKQYMELMAFSRASLIEQLEYDGFTPEQVEFGVNAVGY